MPSALRVPDIIGTLTPSFSDMIEGSKYLTSEEMRGQFLQLLEVKYIWLSCEDDTFVHSDTCGVALRSGGRTKRVSGTLNQYWDRRCQGCPDPLRDSLATADPPQFHRDNRAYTSDNRAYMALRKVAFLYHRSMLNENVFPPMAIQNLAEVLGGIVRLSPELFAEDLIARVHTKRDFFVEKLNSDREGWLLKVAALQMASSGAHLGELEIPEEIDATNRKGIKRTVVSIWRKSQMTANSDLALALIRKNHHEMPLLVKFAEDGFARLDAQYQEGLNDKAIHLVKISPYYMYQDKGQLLEGSIETIGEQKVIRVASIVARYLAAKFKAVDFGPLSEADTPAVWETALTLQDEDMGALSDPASALDAARIIMEAF